MKKAAFIDRDSLLVLALIAGPPKTPLTLEEFHVNEAVRPGLLRLQADDFVLIATTNQPDISRGALSRRELDRMHDVLRRALPLDDILVCPHTDEDHCPCRKPRAGLFHEAAFKHHLLPGQSFVISHRWPDAEAARLIGGTSLLIDSPWLGHGHHDFVVRDFDAAVDKVIERHRVQRKVA